MITGIILALKENGFSAETNKTNVTITATITWNSGSYDYVGVPLALKLDGAQVDYKTGVYFNRSQKTSGSEEFYSYTTDIEHNSNGEKTLACELIYHTNLLGGTRTVSASWTLTQIPRASTIAATAADIGAVSMISVNRKNSDFTHEIAFSFVDLSGYITDADGNVGADPVKMTETSIAFAVPESFYEKIPNDTGGECILTCRTYSGDQQIGAEKTCKFKVTANVDECRPVVKGSVVDVNDATIALTGDPNIIVLGASTALCTMEEEAKNSATVQIRRIGGSSAEENSLQIEKIDQQEITFSVTDSRGYTGTYTVKPSVVSYVPLTCNPAAKRVDPTSGRVLLTVSGKYYSGSFGAADNFLIISIEGNQIPEEDIVFDGDNYTAQVELDGYDYRYSYLLQVTAEDALCVLDKTAAVQKGIPVFDWGENDFQFNVWLGMNGLKICKLGDPEAEDDAANKRYVDSVLGDAGYAESDHKHSAGDVDDGTFLSDRLPTVPVEKGGTNAITADEARTNLGITATQLYSGALSSGAASYSGTYKCYIIIGRTASSNSLQSMVLPAAACDGSVKYQFFADGTYINFTLSTNGLTINSAPSGGAITAIYGVN